MRPNGAPAKALLDLLSKQGEGLVKHDSARRRLLHLGYIRDLGGWMCRLTLEGIVVARALKASA